MTFEHHVITGGERRAAEFGSRPFASAGLRIAPATLAQQCSSSTALAGASSSRK